MVFLPIAPAFADEVAPPPNDASTLEAPQSETLDIREAQPREEVQTKTAEMSESVPIKDGNVNEITDSEVPPVELPSEVIDEEIVSQLSTEENVTYENDVTVNEIVNEQSTDVLSNVQVPFTPNASATSTEVSNTEEETASITNENTTEEDSALPADESTKVDEALPRSDDSNQMSASVEEILNESDTKNEATTTEPLPEEGETVSVNTITNDENKFSFGANECTATGDGTFYCAKTGNVATVAHTDRIFAAPDVDGDKEIYIEKEGELVQITHNTMDDDAPYYDEVSNTAVWHRLIDGRYQIISYDFDAEEETVLTHDRYNNMQPSRFGNVTAWQGWVGNDWEIFFLEGDVLTMLTDNTTHDIAPTLNGTHVIWQAFDGNAWRMKVYDMSTKETTSIDDTNGGSIENPRFVLVYDAKLESGDVETRGYDLKSGKVIHLGAEPTKVPDKLPDPDQTGEKRALVSQITQLKPKTENDDTLPNGEPDPLLTPNLDLTASSTIETTGSTVATSTIASEVIVPPYVDMTTTNTSHIEDVIVTPYVEPSANTASTTSAQ